MASDKITATGVSIQIATDSDTTCVTAASGTISGLSSVATINDGVYYVNGFFVLVDGDETNHNAVSVSEFWTLTIPFSYGSEEIEIIGTYVIPEFGTIAVLVLVAAITTIVMISAKNKQIFYPKI